MNSNNAKLYLPLVQAMVDGKTIQRTYTGEDITPTGVERGRWYDVENVITSVPVSRYRVKPAPRTMYAVLNGKNKVWFSSFDKHSVEIELSDRQRHGSVGPYTLVEFTEKVD